MRLSRTKDAELLESCGCAPTPRAARDIYYLMSFGGGHRLIFPGIPISNADELAAWEGVLVVAEWPYPVAESLGI